MARFYELFCKRFRTNETRLLSRALRSGGCRASTYDSNALCPACHSVHSMDMVCLSFLVILLFSEHCGRIYLDLLKVTSSHFLISHPKDFLGAHLDPTKLRPGGLNCQTCSSLTYFFLPGVCDSQIPSGLLQIPRPFVAFSAPLRNPRMTR